MHVLFACFDAMKRALRIGVSADSVSLKSRNNEVLWQFKAKCAIYLVAD